MHLNKKAISAILLATSALLGVESGQAATAIIGSGSTPAETASAAADFAIYKAVGTSLVLDNTAPLTTILAGNAGAPGGNVELFASSETFNNTAFNAYGGTTSLTGTIGGNTITFSSLNAADWATTVSGGQTLLQQWVKDLVTFYLPVVNPALLPQFEAAILNNNGRQRFSDPNISYAYSQNGQISVGLAGFLDAKSLLASVIPPQFIPTLNLLNKVQISELVKVTYNGQTNFLYGFSATPSGLVAANDGISFTGNYQLSLLDPLNSGSDVIAFQPVPVPAAIWLMFSGIAGLFAATRRRSVA